jgi:hypothetical protein
VAPPAVVVPVAPVPLLLLPQAAATMVEATANTSTRFLWIIWTLPLDLSSLARVQL